MSSRTTAWIGMGLLLCAGCQALGKGDDWSTAAVPVGLTASLPCIPVEQPREKDAAAEDRRFECHAGAVLVKLRFYGGDEPGTYDIDKSAAAIAQAIKKSATDQQGTVDHEQNAMTVSGLRGVRLKSTLVFPDEKSSIEGALISDSEDAWLLQLIFPTRLASELEGKIKNTFQTLQVRPD
jgi:hypothetical protein